MRKLREVNFSCDIRAKEMVWGEGSDLLEVVKRWRLMSEEGIWSIEICGRSFGKFESYLKVIEGVFF